MKTRRKQVRCERILVEALKNVVKGSDGKTEGNLQGAAKQEGDSYEQIAKLIQVNEGALWSRTYCGKVISRRRLRAAL